jgi:hypothetical protein
MPLSSQFRFQNAGGHSVWSAHLCVCKRRLEGPSARRVTFFDASARIKKNSTGQKWFGEALGVSLKDSLKFFAFMPFYERYFAISVAVCSVCSEDRLRQAICWTYSEIRETP